MARRFLSIGFAPSDVQILTPAGKPTQANLVVRYRGRQPAAGKPLLLMAHMDVVPALASDWTVSPFTLTEKDGWFYGRGSIDDKAMAAIFVANLIRARQGGWVPSRDVILVLAADEETGSEDGMQWLVNNHRARIDAAYAINEGANGDLSNGRPASLGVQAAEKVPVTFTLTVTNRGGFSGLPRSDNAIYQLANGLVHLSHYTFPSQLNDVTRAYFDAEGRGGEHHRRRGDADHRAEPERPRRAQDPLGAPELQRDAAHHLRGHPARGGTRQQRAGADRHRHGELPDAAGDDGAARWSGRWSRCWPTRRSR